MYNDYTAHIAHQQRDRRLVQDLERLRIAQERAESSRASDWSEVRRRVRTTYAAIKSRREPAAS
jgi:hypothetical protein